MSDAQAQERIGLLPEPARTASGYRQYAPAHIRRLLFIRRGRDLGFSIDAIRALLRRAGTVAECRIIDALAGSGVTSEKT